MKQYNLEVKWTGCYPCLCHGEWVIKYNGIELDVPEDQKDVPMFTYGEYGRWSFDEDYCEEWDYYTDGLEKEQWIRCNLDWIVKMFSDKGFTIDDDLLYELYDKIQQEDWRQGSCGGCI